MKQGKATTSKMGSTKIEPRSHQVPPAYAAGLGVKQGNHAADGGHTIHHTSVPMYEGRGLTAPMKGVTSHPKGSQGKH